MSSAAVDGQACDGRGSARARSSSASSPPTKGPLRSTEFTCRWTRVGLDESDGIAVAPEEAGELSPGSVVDIVRLG